jgi:hypothetical protein
MTSVHMCTGNPLPQWVWKQLRCQQIFVTFRKANPVQCGMFSSSSLTCILAAVRKLVSIFTADMRTHIDITDSCFCVIWPRKNAASNNFFTRCELQKQNKGTDYERKNLKIQKRSKATEYRFCEHVVGQQAVFTLRLLDYLGSWDLTFSGREDGGSMLLRNAAAYLQVHTALLPRRPTWTYFEPDSVSPLFVAFACANQFPSKFVLYQKCPGFKSRPRDRLSCCFPCLSSVPPLDHGRFLPYPFQLMNHPITRRYVAELLTA